MIEAEASNFLLPRIVLADYLTKMGLKQVEFATDSAAQARLSERLKVVLSFLEEAARSLHCAFNQACQIAFTALAGDTHNGGRRPLLIEADGRA